jgi:hypothetical protein
VAWRESTLGPMVYGEDSRSVYLPLEVASERWAKLRDEGGYVALTDADGAPRALSEGQLTFDWGRGWLSRDRADSREAEALRHVERVQRQEDAGEIPSREELIARMNKRFGRDL